MMLWKMLTIPSILRLSISHHCGRTGVFVVSDIEEYETMPLRTDHIKRVRDAS